MPEITVVGSINMDLVVRVPHLPLPGETILGRDYQAIPGGKGANQAVGLAEGKRLVDAARMGNAAGAVAVTRLGAQPSMPRREEIDRLLSDNPAKAFY